MKIEHVAMYVNDLENVKNFFIRFFDAEANEGYHNPRSGLRTYFLSFEDGSRLELTERLYEAGYEVISGPRITGDGYYESCILGPEDNQIEITE